MRAKVTNLSFVLLLVAGFTMFVAGLDQSRGFADTSADEPADAAEQRGTEQGLTWVDDEAAATRATGVNARARTGAGSAPAGRGLAPQQVVTPTPTRTPTPVNIGNFVWDDIDEDGRQDAGEPGLGGYVVQLWNPAKNDLIDSDTTDGNGAYSVVAPTPGDYRVRVVVNSSDTFSPQDQAGGDDTEDSDINPTGVDAGFTDVFNLASNVISTTTIDAGVIIFRTPTPTRTPTPVNIGNFVWDDIDQDGRQDAGEPGLGGYTVQLWNPAKTSLIDSDTTDGNGAYTVVAPTPGDYRVRVVLGSGDTFSPKDQAGGDDLDDSDINPTGVDAGFTDVFNLASNVISITSIDAGVIIFRTPTPTRTPTPVNIGNFVWDDQDSDGIQDPAEPGAPGYTVQLWNPAKNDLIDSDVSDANGAYTVVAPTPGDYRVRVVLNGGDAFTDKDAGSDDLEDSDINPTGVDAGFTDVFNLASNVISTTSVDAGILDPATPVATPTPTPTNTPTPTPTNTPTPSVTPTATPDPTATNTPTPTATPAPPTTIDTGSGPGVPGSPTASVAVPVIRSGETQTGTGRGFRPGEVVTGTQQSVPFSLGQQTADAAGVVTFQWTIRPGETVGPHTFIAAGAQSGTASAPFQVVDPSGNLPSTGSSGTSTTLLWAFAAIVLGVTITITVNRSLRRSEPD
ncbi:MAG: SdrD B-like domain-containing protein [Ilumatobacteraceae bacterium]